MFPEFSLHLLVYLAGVAALTLIAAVTDLRLKKIPNSLTLPFFGAGLLYQVTFNGFGAVVGKPGLIDAVAAFAAGFGVLWVLWMIGGGGGGDVKLMGALSVWIGFKQTYLVLVVSTALVALMTIALMVASAFKNGVFRSKEVFSAAGNTEGHQPSTSGGLAARSRRRIMGFAPPVALATWLVVLWKLSRFPGL